MKGVQPRVKRTRGGEFLLKLPPVERDVLRSLPAQLRQLLGTDDPALERLFPPAYRDDPLAQADYEEMVHGDLISKKLTSIDVMEQTIDTERLSEEQLLAWLGAINDLRLVLGTRLEVTEEMYEEEMPDDAPRRRHIVLPEQIEKTIDHHFAFHAARRREPVDAGTVHRSPDELEVDADGEDSCFELRHRIARTTNMFESWRAIRASASNRSMGSQRRRNAGVQDRARRSTQLIGPQYTP